MIFLENNWDIGSIEILRKNILKKLHNTQRISTKKPTKTGEWKQKETFKFFIDA